MPGKTVSSLETNACAYAATCAFSAAFEYGVDGTKAPATLPPV